MPTVAEILALDVLQRGLPEVVAGRESLDREVRWVHISEVPDIAHLLRGGELVLTTGIALGGDRDRLVRFIGELAAVGTAAVVVELGRGFSRALPHAAITAANRLHLPLIELHREVPFVSVTEAAHALIFESQLADLRAAQQINSRFTELNLEGASTAEILAWVTRLTGQVVVLESLVHQPLAIEAAGLDVRDTLLTWEDVSRRVVGTERTCFDDAVGWLVTQVGARGQIWGRLVLVCRDRPSTSARLTLERAAVALALSHLIEQESGSPERMAHGSLLADIVSHGRPMSDSAVQARALGFALDSGRLIGIVLRPRVTTHATRFQLRELSDVSAAVTEQQGLQAIVGRLSEQAVGLLLSIESRQPVDDVLDRLVRALRQRITPAGHAASPDFVVGAGSVVSGPDQARRTLLEASMMVDAALDDPQPRQWHAVRHLELSGVFRLLKDDPRLVSFIEAKLGPLLAYDTTHGNRLISTLSSYLRMGGNKSSAAAASHLSRAVFYDRLARIQKITGVDLDDPEARLSLHAAMVAYQAVRRTEYPGAAGSAASRLPVPGSGLYHSAPW
jgi:PucR family transcriptional regulator, purine catabolism regulatory protein